MRPISVSSFYRRPSDPEAYIEDGSFINQRASIFGVADGVSEAYSPSHPLKLYPTGMTGGQIATREFCVAGLSAWDISDSNPADVRQILLNANAKISFWHRRMGKEPTDNVGGAGFAICKIGPDKITFILGGDCFVFWSEKEEPFFLSGFDEAAFRMEEEDNFHYAECLDLAESDKGKAWDLHWKNFEEKQKFCANKNIGQGGFALLNGDPALKNCWTIREIEKPPDLQWILLGTDGLLPFEKTDPQNRADLATEMHRIYSKGGLPSLLEWRDKNEQSLFHIDDWPEASAIEIKF